MKVGLDAYTIREMNLDPFGMLDYAKNMQFEGIQFEDITIISPGRDAGRLREIAEYAKQLGMFSYITVQRPNPYLYEGTGDELYEACKTDVRLAAENGWHEVRANVGRPLHRHGTKVPYLEQLRATTEFLKTLRPVLKEYQVRINLETHGDVTSYELLRIIDEVGPEYIGITLDTGNLLIHGDYPAEAVKRLAPYTHLTHAKDGLLRLCDKGLVRQGMPPGRGSVEWPKVIEVLAKEQPQINLCIEDYKKRSYAEIFDPAWLADHPDMTSYEMGQLVRLAYETAEKEKLGGIPEMMAYEEVPYLEQAEDRLSFGRDYLKSLLREMNLYG